MKGFIDMSLYIESIAKHDMTTKNKCICAVSIVLGSLFSVFAFLFFDWYTIFLVGLIFFFVYRIICAQDYEYEYILDDKELCVYKIIHKSSRKKLLSAPVEKIISFSSYHEEPLSGAVIDAATEISTAMILKISDNKRTHLLFSPNPKMTDALQKILSHR